MNGSNIFAGTLRGGVFLSTNNGATWIPVNSGLPANTYATSFAVSGNNIFATGDGVFLSTNNGTSWTAVNSGLPADSRILCSAVSGNNIFVGGKNGVFRSTNNGTNWTPVNSGFPANTCVLSLAISGNNIFAGTNDGGVFTRPVNYEESEKIERDNEISKKNEFNETALNKLTPYQQSVPSTSEIQTRNDLGPSMDIHSDSIDNYDDIPWGSTFKQVRRIIGKSKCSGENLSFEPTSGPYDGNFLKHLFRYPTDERFATATIYRTDILPMSSFFSGCSRKGEYFFYDSVFSFALVTIEPESYKTILDELGSKHTRIANDQFTIWQGSLPRINYNYVLFKKKNSDTYIYQVAATCQSLIDNVTCFILYIPAKQLEKIQNNIKNAIKKEQDKAIQDQNNNTQNDLNKVE